ncbi:MAG: zinc-binding dehydrogenase [Candidatus Sericytochromatia bacterium]
MGAAEVAVQARHPHQHEARERIGAATPTGGYDVVIETGGSEGGLHLAVELARAGGTVVHLGMYDADTAWPMDAAFMKEVALRPRSVIAATTAAGTSWQRGSYCPRARS